MTDERCRLCHALAVVAVLAIPTASVAQEAAGDSATPGRGTWAAEVAFGGFVDATLLRFSSARSAWLVGGRIAGDVRREERARTRFDTARRETTGALAASARVGHRRYGVPARRLRPLVGAGLLGSYQRDGDDYRVWAAGAYGETGAAYFFTPHVSLGAAGELQAVYTDQRQGGGRLRVRSVRASGTLVRVLGTVYF